MTTLSELRERLEKARDGITDEGKKALRENTSQAWRRVEAAVRWRDQETTEVLLDLLSALEKESAE